MQHELDQVAFAATAKEAEQITQEFIGKLSNLKPQTAVFQARKVFDVVSFATIQTYNAEAGLWDEIDLLRHVLFNTALDFQTLMAEPSDEHMKTWLLQAERIIEMVGRLQGSHNERLAVLADWKEWGA